MELKKVRGLEMGEVTDEVCEKCGAHADLIQEETPLCASCYLKEAIEE